ncbi:MAG: TadE family protein [Myxococcota bacterium]
MKRRSLADDERAAVYVEFLVVFMPVFMLFLGMTQIGMLFTGKLVVRHASYRAARSAIVVLPDDPARYGGAPVDQVSFNETPSGGITGGSLGSFAAFFGVDIPENIFARGDSRLNMVRLSAAVPILALAPSPQYLQSTTGIRFGGGSSSAESLLDGIGFTGRGMDNIGGRFGAGLLYTAAAMAVTFPNAPGGVAQTEGTVSPGGHEMGSTQELTARVTFAYPCVVPGASALICDGYNRVRTQGDGSGRNELNAAIARGASLLAGRGAYYALRAETTMTYHGASYDYDPR